MNFPVGLKFSGDVMHFSVERMSFPVECEEHMNTVGEHLGFQK